MLAHIPVDFLWLWEFTANKGKPAFSIQQIIIIVSLSLLYRNSYSVSSLIWIYSIFVFGKIFLKYALIYVCCPTGTRNSSCTCTNMRQNLLKMYFTMEVGHQQFAKLFSDQKLFQTTIFFRSKFSFGSKFCFNPKKISGP